MKTNEGGGKENQSFPLRKDGTGVRDAVEKNLTVLISILIHNAWLEQHAYFSQFESTAVFQLPTEAISEETTVPVKPTVIFLWIGDVMIVVD